MAISNILINPLQYYKFSWAPQASDAANSTYLATIFRTQTDTVGTNQGIPIAPNQIWKVVDVNITTTSTPGYSLDLIVGGTPQNINIILNTTALSLGTTRINPFALMPNQGLLVGANTTLGIQIVSQAANGTVAQTLYGNLGVAAFPVPKK